jgi:SAM-dependent methyltransferase
MISLHCPACSSIKAENSLPNQLKQSGSDYLPSNYYLLECDHCGLVFKDKMPSLENLKKHYQSLDALIGGWNYAERLPHERKIDKILSNLPDNSQVLDVGCWIGRLLSEHRDRLKIYGIEPNSSAAKIAKDNGLIILGTEVTTQLRSQYSFDCITMVDVFEHLPNPIDVLDNLISSLKISGKLVIVTGQTDCLPAWFIGSSYWYFAIPDHLVFLNRRFANWLQKRNATIKVTYVPVRHFDFTWNRRFFELAWLICWRFLSPHSPFPKPDFYKLPGFRRFQRLQQPIICGTWKDHALLHIERLS